MVVVDGKGLPLGVRLESASPAEVKLAEATLACIAVPRNGPGRQLTENGLRARAVMDIHVIAFEGLHERLCHPLHRESASKGNGVVSGSGKLTQVGN